MKAKKISLVLTLAITIIFNQKTIAQSNTPCGAPNLPVNAICLSTPGTTAGATAQTDAANGGNPSCGFMGPDVWYSLVAPLTGSIRIQTTAGSINDGVMALYSGPCGSLTQVLCVDNFGGSFMPSFTTYNLTPGATYYVRFWRNGGGTGTFGICATASLPPIGNAVCSTQTPICSGSPITFSANAGGVPASQANPGNSYGCLSTSPNPSWYYLEIATGGNLVVNISAGSDVDFAIWGPFPNLAAGTAACNNYGTPTDCSYSTAATEQVNVPGVITGQVYVLLVTNFANTIQNISVNNSGGGGTATTNCGIVPLPVGYTSWQAHLANNKVRLSWTTESETNSDYYAIQRLTNGGIWETVGFVKAAGNSSTPLSYSFTDENPVEGINYYRLKQVDLDGKAHFTNTIPVEYNIVTDLEAYPNPTTGLVLVKENAFSIKAVDLIDVTGRSWELPYSKGNTGVSVDVSNHAKGTYTLRSTDEMGNLRSTLLILE